MKEKGSERGSPRPPLRVTGVLFALALNLLLVSAGMMVTNQLGAIGLVRPLLMLGAAALGGVVTTLYVGQRGGVHAFVGGMLSIPLLGFLIVPGEWAFAIYAGTACALGGLLTQQFRRQVD